LWGRQVPQILAEYRVHSASMVRCEMSVPDNKRQLIALMHERHPWISLAESFPHARRMMQSPCLDRC